MEIYLLKFSGCLLVLWLVYVLLLEHQKMHQFKRLYLLMSFAASLIIPLLSITYYVEPIAQNFEIAPIYIPIESSYTEIPNDETTVVSLKTILWCLYGLGVLLFASRFLVNLTKLYQNISKSERIKKHSFIYVLLKEYRIPHSFFKYIFLNQAKFENDTIPKEVLLHEETHAKQLHSIDIILLELLQIAFWFHPLIYVLKHHVKLNHEFLADQAVLNEGTEAKTYQNILLQFSSNTQDYQLSSAINYSSFKKRFTVMKTQTSKARIWLSTILLLPIIIILFYSFAEKEYVEKETLETSEVLQIKNDALSEGATEAMIKEYNDWIIKFDTTHHIDYVKYQRIVAIYDIMTEDQKASVEKYPAIPDTNLSKVEPKSPTISQFEAFKNAKEYAIWIDGKHVSNEVLNDHSVSDFIHVTGSMVHKNAQSKKFPQPFQFHLYTKDGFNKFYKEAYVSDYKTLSKTYSNAIKTYLKGLQTDNYELRILKAQADKFYNQFTKEDIKRHNIQPLSPVPSKRSEHTDGIKEYLKKYEKYEALRSSEPHYINKSEQEQKEMDALFSELGSMYFRMSKSAKAKVKRPVAPIRPYVKITLNGKTYYKKYEELTSEEKATLPPPPPPPTKKSKGGPEAQDYYNPSFLEYIIEMEQLGASFYLDDEKISAKKAKSIATNNKSKKTEMLTQKDANGFYVVKLSSSQKNTLQQKATPSQVKEYNKLAKHYNSILQEEYHRILLKDVEKMKYIYGLMSEEQRKNAEPFPNFPKPPPPPPAPELIEVIEQEVPTPPSPNLNAEELELIEEQELPAPPPPPTKVSQYKNGKKKTLNEIIKETPKGVQSGYEILDNGESHYYTIYKGKKTYYNKDGYITNEKGDVLPPPPPAPESTLDFVIRMAKANAKFFNKGKAITSDNAINLIKKNPKLNVNAKGKSNEGRSLVYISKKPILIGVKGDSPLIFVNGKKLSKSKESHGYKIALTREEFKRLKLTLSNGKITRFKIKITGIKTNQIKGNFINAQGLEDLKNYKKGYITLFDFKDTNDSKLPPIFIELKE